MLHTNLLKQTVLRDFYRVAPEKFLNVTNGVTPRRVTLKHPDWSDHSHSLAFTVQSVRTRFLLHGMLNAYWEPLAFELPPVPSECPQA